MTDKSLKKDVVVHQNKLSYGKFEEFELRELKLLLKFIVEYSRTSENKLFLNAKEIKSFINMDRKSYTEFETLVRKLGKREILIKDQTKNRYVVYHIFSKLDFDLDNKTVELSYASDFIPLITNLEKNFCKYDLKNIENLKSKYSLMFYIRAKAEMFKGKFYMSVEELGNLYGKKYTKYIENLDKKVVIPMLKEINEYTDILISSEKEYEAQKRGRSKVKGYLFRIEKKKLLISSEIRKAVEKVKKNIYISKSKVLNEETIQILLSEFGEKRLIAGFNYAYKTINKDFNTLEYLKKVIYQNEELERDDLETIVLEEKNNKDDEQILTSSDEVLEMEDEILVYAIEKLGVQRRFLEGMKRNNPMLYKLTLQEYEKLKK
ncbi:replication initiation protein [uncultured Fusobacterium sp.]|uniref:replication initiation protein n=1 Tax=uncultured Fusobacterium sp. TaxID=159267 RepID=UPI00259ABA3E|nr:replication initiation protein [uncultured Fusobacterium sp.]